MRTVAVLGLGTMGSGMANRLLGAGFALTVYNRTASRAEALSAAGAKVARTPAEAASNADVVISMLADDNASRAWVSSIAKILGRQGFYRRAGIVTSAHNFWHNDGRMIAIEIGGPDTNGHYLHLMKSWTAFHEHV